MLTMAHQLDASERSRSRALAPGRRAPPHNRAHGFDRDDIGLAVHELHAQPGELPELRALRIGPATLGHLARRVRDGRRRHLEQLRDCVAEAWRRCGAGAAHLADRLLDAFQQVRQRREVVQRGKAAQRLQCFEDLLQRVVRRRIRSERPSGAIERARNRRAFACDEGARAGVEPQRLRGAHLARRASAQLLELAGQCLRFGGIGLGPACRLTHEDLEVVDRPRRDLLRCRVPGTPALAHATRERLEAHRRPRYPLLARH